jgi:hypothetical protein
MRTRWTDLTDVLEKATKRVEVTSEHLEHLAEKHGPWEHGDRHSALTRMNAMGRPAARAALQTHPPTSIDHQAGKLDGELRGMATQRGVAATKAKKFSADDSTHTFSPEDVHLNAQAYAAHHETIDSSKRERTERGQLRETRSQTVMQRNRMMSAAHHKLAFDESDMDATEAAVAHMGSIGALSPQEHNRTAVMHAAIHLQRDSHTEQHKDIESQHKFSPSWTSLEPVALHTMHRSTQYMNPTEAARLHPILSTAIVAQAAHPAPTRSRGGSIATGYPEIGSMREHSTADLPVPVQTIAKRARTNVAGKDTTDPDILRMREEKAKRSGPALIDDATKEKYAAATAKQTPRTKERENRALTRAGLLKALEAEWNSRTLYKAFQDYRAQP